MFAGILDEVRRISPLVHCITNYVTVNDCANVLLACGASPVMADDEREAEEIDTISSAWRSSAGITGDAPQSRSRLALSFTVR